MLARKTSELLPSLPAIEIAGYLVLGIGVTSQ